MKLNLSLLLSVPGKIWWLCLLVASTELQNAHIIAKERKVGNDYITIQSIAFRVRNMDGIKSRGP